MPEKQFITAIPGVQVLDIQEGKNIEIIGRPRMPDVLTCIHCQSQNQCRIKSTHERTFNHAKLGRKLVELRLKIPKLFCKLCKRYFMFQVPGILPRKRSTEAFRLEVYHLHQGGLTQIHLSKTHSISCSTVERWYQDFVGYRVKELAGRSCPIILGIDEHFFSRKDGYATTFVDLKNHKVFDVVLGRSEASLRSYLKNLPGREKVKVVVMDLSDIYRSLVEKYFPNAMIVADRFHVIRLLNFHFLKAWQNFDPEGRKNRGLLSLMRRHSWNLKHEQVPKLNEYLAKNPVLKLLYDFKQDLCKILLSKHLNQKQVKDLIPQFLWHLNECLQSPIQAIQTFGQTLKSWMEPIVRMWRFTKSNGITEGLHNKMEMISRRAFGFRNFKNYRLRVIALCGWDGVFRM